MVEGATPRKSIFLHCMSCVMGVIRFLFSQGEADHDSAYNRLGLAGAARMDPRAARAIPPLPGREGRRAAGLRAGRTIAARRVQTACAQSGVRAHLGCGIGGGPRRAHREAARRAAGNDAADSARTVALGDIAEVAASLRASADRA